MKIGIEIVDFSLPKSDALGLVFRLIALYENGGSKRIANPRLAIPTLLGEEKDSAKRARAFRTMGVTAQAHLSPMSIALLKRLAGYDFGVTGEDLFANISIYRSEMPEEIFLEGENALDFIDQIARYPYVAFVLRAKDYSFSKTFLTVGYDVYEEGGNECRISPYLILRGKIKGAEKRLAFDEVLFVGDWALYHTVVYPIGPGFSALKKRIQFNPKTNAFVPITVNEKTRASFTRHTLPVLEALAPVPLPSFINRNETLDPCRPALYLDYDGKRLLGALAFRYGKKETPVKIDRTRYEEAAPAHIDAFLRDEKAEAKFAEEFKDLFGVHFAQSSSLHAAVRETDEVAEYIATKIPLFLKQSGDWIIITSARYKKNAVVQTSSMHCAVGARQSVDWFAMNFSIDGLNEKDAYGALYAVKRKKKYYKREDGVIVDLSSPETAQLLTLMKRYGIDLEQRRIPAYQTFALIERGAKGIVYSEDAKALVRALKEEKAPPFIDAALKKALRPYQIEGVRYLSHIGGLGFGAILGDEMGLGKTLQALAYISALKKSKHEERRPAIVVCPASLVFNWIEEAKRFTPNLRVAALDGTKEARERALLNADADVFVTSYARLAIDAPLHAEKMYRAIILDEAQHIKNEKSKRAKMTKMMRAPLRVALTGTPIENRLDDLWSIFDFLMPGYLGTHKEFEEEFAAPIACGNKARMEELKKRARPFILKRKKEDVAKELPARIEQTLHCEMTDAQRALYCAVRDRAKADMRKMTNAEGISKTKLHIFAALTKLKQICCHPSLIARDIGAYLTPNDAKNITSAKTELFFEIAEEIVESGRKALVFSQFTSMLDILERGMKEKGYAFVRLDGSTKDRKAVVTQFQKKSGPPFFLLSLKAGGTGLTLTEADAVILYDPWWNPAVERQAMDRAHRIGQTKTVNVYRLAVKGAIDDRIIALQSSKKALAEQTLDEGDFSFAALNEEELFSLFG